MSPASAHVLVWAPTAAAVAVAMDGWAALLHRCVWHRRLWRVHVSHHRRRAGRFEANDVLSASHAPLAFALVILGCVGSPGPARELSFGVGLGMSIFGVAYVLVHDGLAHRRLPVERLLRVPVLGRYLFAVVRAHRRHHRRGGGPPFGLFFGPWERCGASHRVTPHREAPLGQNRAPSDRGT